MTTFTPEPTLSLPAAAILAADTFVTMNGSGQWAQSDAGAMPDAILGRASVAVGDVTRAQTGPWGARWKCRADGVIGPGQLIMVSPTGGAVVFVAGNGAFAVGKAVDGAAIAGTIISYIHQPGRVS